jgi:hypothetical protein
MCSYIWSSRISCDCKSQGEHLILLYNIYIYIITWSRGRKEGREVLLGARGKWGGGRRVALLADLLWHVGSQDLHWYAGKIIWTWKKILLKKIVWDYMLLEVWIRAVEDWSVYIYIYVRRATKWKCHMPWCSSNSSSSSSSNRPVQYNFMIRYLY